MLSTSSSSGGKADEGKMNTKKRSRKPSLDLDEDPMADGGKENASALGLTGGVNVGGEADVIGSKGKPKAAAGKAKKKVR